MHKILRKAPVVGFVRYSQKIAFSSGAKAKDVFQSDYFEYRFEIFKKITLKSFQQQTDRNFVLLLLHSESMPSDIRKRFITLEEKNSFLQNVFVEDTFESLNNVIADSVEHILFEDDIAVTFRIDNDDAVPSDFIYNLHNFAKRDFVGYTINTPTIIAVKKIASTSFMIEEKYYPSNSIGLAYVTKKAGYKTVMEIGHHHLITQDNPLILLAKSNAVVLMTINGENETNNLNTLNSRIVNKEDFNHYLKERKIENLELDCLRIFTKKRSISETIELFLPPAYYFLIEKIRNIFSS